MRDPQTLCYKRYKWTKWLINMKIVLYDNQILDGGMKRGEISCIKPKSKGNKISVVKA